MKIYYSLSSQLVLTDSDRDKKLSLLKQAGVTNINLLGYFWGHFESSINQMVQARDILVKEGFEVGIISVGIGHPGNSIDPNDPNLDLRLPSHWRYRHNRKGNPINYCGDIEDNLIRDNGNAVKEFLDNGFDLIFFDDDTRLGNWGNEIQGCFCPECIRSFNEQYHLNETLNSISKSIQNLKDHELLTNWVNFNCNKLFRFFDAIKYPSSKLGLMVMARGDERHGIDIPGLQQHFPELLYRVGEEHFSDHHFESPQDKVSELMGMIYHLNFMNPSLTFSETTVFPMQALSPENLVYKAKMALVLGIPNIYLMNGLGFLDENYWNCFIKQNSELRSLAEVCLSEYPNYPIHILAGTHGSFGESIHNSPLPFLAGLPSKPVRVDQIENGAEILFVMGKFKLTQLWQMELKKYRFLIFDSTSYRYNKDIIKNYPQINFEIIPSSIMDLIKQNASNQILTIQKIRDIISKQNPIFPFLKKGNNIGLIWRSEQASVILLNLERKPNQCELAFQNRIEKIHLNSLEIRNFIL